MAGGGKNDVSQQASYYIAFFHRSVILVLSYDYLISSVWDWMGAFGGVARTLCLGRPHLNMMDAS